MVINLVPFFFSQGTSGNAKIVQFPTIILVFWDIQYESIII